MSNVIEMKERLKELTKSMDIPSFRSTSIPWLHRNMAIRNKEHPDFEEAKNIVLELLKMGVR